MLKVDRSLYVYKSRRGEQAELKLKIKDICQTRVPYGYRRVHILIKREGWPVNSRRIYCLYKEMDLQLRNKVPKRLVFPQLDLVGVRRTAGTIPPASLRIGWRRAPPLPRKPGYRSGAVVSLWSRLFPASKPKSGRNSTYHRCSNFPSQLCHSGCSRSKR